MKWLRTFLLLGVISLFFACTLKECNELLDLGDKGSTITNLTNCPVEYTKQGTSKPLFVIQPRAKKTLKPGTSYHVHESACSPGGMIKAEDGKDFAITANGVPAIP